MKLSELIDEVGTRTKHGNGAKLPIGETGQWLMVVGCDSEIGQQVQWDIMRINPKADNAISLTVKAYAKLIIGWSLDEPLTHKKAVKVIEEVPSLLNQILDFYKDNSNFTKP